MKLARAAGQTLHQFVFDFIQNGLTDTIYDSVILFDLATHVNLLTTALSSAALATARLEMKQQTAFNTATEVLGTNPRYILVPQELEETAWRLLNSAVLVGAGDQFSSTEPNFHSNRGMEVIVVDYWTNAGDWFLVGDPARIPTIEVGFLNGREDPELFVQDQPNVGSVMSADKITYKIRHIYSGAVLDFRGLHGSNV